MSKDQKGVYTPFIEIFRSKIREELAKKDGIKLELMCEELNLSKLDIIKFAFEDKAALSAFDLELFVMMFGYRMMLSEMTYDDSFTAADHLRFLIRSEVEGGRSLRDIALKAGVAPSALSKFMNGKTLVLETADAIAKSLGKRLGYLERE